MSSTRYKHLLSLIQCRCYDVWNNIYAGATILNEGLQSSGGSVPATVGAFNGWYQGMTVGDVQAVSICSQRQNLDYLNNLFNYWLQNKTPGAGSYCESSWACCWR